MPINQSKQCRYYSVMCRFACKQTEALFAQECTDLSDLQCPQRWRSIHPDDQFPTVQKKRTDQRREREMWQKKKKTKIRLGSPKWIKYETYFSPEHDDSRQGLWTQLMSLHKIELSCLQLNNSGVAGNVHVYSKRKVIFIKSKGNLQPYCFLFLANDTLGLIMAACLPACALICSYESAAYSRGQPIPFLSSLCQAPYSCGARAYPVSPATN